ncbi:ATPase H(+)-transporting accessory protein 2 isoform X3 [Odontomachus brunneus]|uniref:ATPase H(+)-transporting accessory protein 2 isoform X3 n=1 Tax=Odontomachus brunneus TaxID=486640 RepID=UPI0013F192BC|nr:ATPase H(+)-transporting accessory protein 2 isoform X3 [Odontomachus brunneus]
MLRQLSLLLAGLAAVQASGKFAVLHSPESVEFNVNGEIEQSVLKEILSAALGYTGKQKDTEHSIAIWDPFSMPKALVAMPIEGIEMLSFIKDKAKVEYAMIFDEAEETTWQAIRSRVEERSNDNALVRINLSDGVDALGQSALGELKPANIEKLTVLNSEIEEDRKFIEEMQLLNAIADNASSTKKHDSGTDVYWIVVSALKPVLDLHGNNSEAAKEAYTLLNDAMERTSKAFVNAYDGKVVIAAFTNDASKVRNARSVLLERRSRETDAPAYKTNSVKSADSAKGAPTSSNFNDNLLTKPEFSGRAKTYTEDYPVIFNIILWFGVIFVFSLLVICIAIGDMDPGRDSIIYRMTSNRMKKDN